MNIIVKIFALLGFVLLLVGGFISEYSTYERAHRIVVSTGFILICAAIVITLIIIP